MLSLSPRYDLFKFSLPNDFLPKEVEEKYQRLLTKNAGVLATPIDYLNESIQSINFPGMTDIIVTQIQHSSNDIKRSLGKLNVEPKREQIYSTTANPLDKIEQSFKVTFRMNQGLYNYFMLYETTFHQICKPQEYKHRPIFFIELMDEDGVVTSRIIFRDVLIDGIEGLEFSFNKVERESGTFDVTFRFSNIDFEFR